MVWKRSALLILLLVVSSVSSSSDCSVRSFSNVTVTAYYNRTARAHLYTNFDMEKLKSHYRLDVIHAHVTRLCSELLDPYFAVRSLSLINVGLEDVELEAFTGLVNLRHLSLAVNRLTEVLNGQYNRITSLESLYLSNNTIRVIEKNAFDNMIYLQKVYLDRNQITELNGDWFLNCPQLRIIQLAYNNITFVPALAFKHIQPYHRDMVEYFLDNNQIVAMSQRAFDDDKPMILHLERNQISDISVPVFRNLKSVHILYLNYNQITCLTSEVIDELKTTTIILYISDNPLTCNCIVQFDMLIDANALATDFYYNTTLECPPFNFKGMIAFGN